MRAGWGSSWTKRPGTPAPTSNEIAADDARAGAGVRDPVNHLACCLGFAGALVSPSNRAAFILLGLSTGSAGIPRASPVRVSRKSTGPPIPLVPRVEERPGSRCQSRGQFCGCGPEGSPPFRHDGAAGGLLGGGSTGRGHPGKMCGGLLDGGAQGRRLGATEAQWDRQRGPLRNQVSLRVASPSEPRGPSQV